LLTHTEGDLEAWEERAEETCRAMPIASFHDTRERKIGASGD
jgi:hypothetical protein